MQRWASSRSLSRLRLTQAGPLSSFCRSYASASTTTPELFDVVCVGGGPAGLSLVNALRSSRTTAGLKVALIESQNLSKGSAPPTSQYSNRCSSLTPASAGFLQDVGAWQHLDLSRIQPYDRMQVWDGVSGSRITFDWPSATSFLTPAPRNAADRTIAYMTENINLTSALLSRAHELGDITFLDNTRVSDISLGNDTPGALDLSSWPIVTLSSGQTLAARLLVGADGANSPVRTFAGIESRGWDYERHGVVATLHLDESSAFPYHGQGTAYQRFLPSGPVALLPLPDGSASLVWSTLPAYAAHLKTLGAEDLTAMVNAAFRLSPVDLAYLHTIPSGQADEVAWREKHTSIDASLIPPRIAQVHKDSVASFPLRMRHADTYVGERVALIGDAAHTVHPLAGQGLNAGQADVAALAATIGDAVRTGQDIGSTIALESYVGARYAANNALLGVVDKLHKLYSVQSGPLVGLRSLGLSAVDKLGFVKGLFMKGAAGKML